MLPGLSWAKLETTPRSSTPVAANTFFTFICTLPPCGFLDLDFWSVPGLGTVPQIRAALSDKDALRPETITDSGGNQGCFSPGLAVHFTIPSKFRSHAIFLSVLTGWREYRRVAAAYNSSLLQFFSKGPKGHSSHGRHEYLPLPDS